MLVKSDTNNSKLENIPAADSKVRPGTSVLVSGDELAGDTTSALSPSPI